MPSPTTRAAKRAASAHSVAGRSASALARRERQAAQAELPLRDGKDPGKHASAFDAKVKAGLDAGTYVDPSAGLVTFREYAEEWRKSRVHDLATATRIESAFRNHAYAGPRTSSAGSCG
jgi:hypothetical protein